MIVKKPGQKPGFPHIQLVSGSPPPPAPAAAPMARAPVAIVVPMAPVIRVTPIAIVVPMAMVAPVDRFNDARSGLQGRQPGRGSSLS